MRLITSVALFLIIFSTIATAFTMSNPTYEIEGVIDSGGNFTDDGTYEAQVSVGQAVITPESGLLESDSYRLCLGIFCSEVFETPYSVYVTGYLTYDIDDPVVDGKGKLIVKYGGSKYMSKEITTDANGKFEAEAPIPEAVALKEFTIEVRAKGRVEAAYECIYCPGDGTCTFGGCEDE